MYKNHNTLVWEFLDRLTKVQKQALGKRRHFIWIFDRGFADVKLMIRLKQANIHFIIRVKQNVGVEVLGYVGTLKDFNKRGYFENIVYHKEKRIKVNLFWLRAVTS